MTSQWKIPLLTVGILATFGLIFMTVGQAHATLQQGDIVSFWPLDETGTITSYADPVNGYNGSPVGGLTPTTEGQINGAQSFDGTDDGILVTGQTDFNFGAEESFSIAAWIKVAGDAPSENKVVVGRLDSPNDQQWWLGVQSTTGFARFFLRDGIEERSLASLSSVADGIWYHIVGVRDAANDQVLLYVNDLAPVTQDAALADGFDSSTADVTIGYFKSFNFQGTIDEVTIYNRALDATEVQQLFNGQDGPRNFVDLDNDGISDGEENAGPNGGDGNIDGIPDMNQNTVASLLMNDGTDYATIETDAGTLANCQAVANPSPDDAPSGKNFDWGFFEFTINGVGFGNPATVKLRTPAGSAPTTYWKYGPTDPLTPAVVEWYEFMDDGTTGAQITDNIVTLEFVDGQRGDDTAEDGIIVDQGGPATVTAKSSGGGGGGGGGCFIATAGD
jgi:hypothetical protein